MKWTKEEIVEAIAEIKNLQANFPTDGSDELRRRHNACTIACEVMNDAIANGSKEEKSASWLLISTFERSLNLKQFHTKESARKRMLDELEEEYLKQYDATEETWTRLKECTEYDCDDFGFSELSAWSNIDKDCCWDWRIYEIR